MEFKSPQVHLIGKIKEAVNFGEDLQSIYATVEFKTGESWRISQGINKIETFQSCVKDDKASLEHPIYLHYSTEDMRGWPRILAELWAIDQDGRHSIVGYGTIMCPFGAGEYTLEIPCWRPKGTWFDNFIGAHPELQHKNIMVSSMNRYGLKTCSTGRLIIQLKVLTKDFHLHGVIAS